MTDCNIENEKKYLLEKLQEIFVFPEDKTDKIIDSLLNLRKNLLENKIDKFRSLNQVNEILIILGQNQVYFNQYYLYCIMNLPDSRLKDINQFLVGSRMCRLHCFS